MSVLSQLSKHLDLLEFFIKNPEEWFSIKDLKKHFTGDVSKIYTGVEALYNYGFILKERKSGNGKAMWMKLDTSSIQSQIITSLYVVMRDMGKTGGKK